MIDRLQRLLGRSRRAAGRSRTSDGVAAAPAADREAKEQAKRRIDAAQQRLKQTIPPPDDPAGPAN